MTTHLLVYTDGQRHQRRPSARRSLLPVSLYEARRTRASRPRILPRPPAHHQIAHSGSAKGAVDDFITSACPETRPFGLARSFKPSPSRRSTAHSATDDQDHKLRDRFASLSASSPARRALLEKSSLAAWRALNLDLALRRACACSSGERRCKPWSRRPNLGVLHVSVRWSNCHFKGRSGPPFVRVVEKPKV